MRARSFADVVFTVQAFQFCDENDKGFLTRSELRRAALMLFGYKPSRFETDKFFRQSAEQIGGTMGVSESQFYNLLRKRLEAADRDELYRDAFLAIDWRARGFISKEDFEAAVRHVAPHFAEKTLVKAFDSIDSDGDGRVTFRDFANAMKLAQTAHAHSRNK